MRKALRYLLILILVFSSGVLRAQTTPTQVLHGTITSADLHGYKELPFNVPVGTRRITITFAYTARDQRTVIDIGVFDPQRFRGWSGGNKEWFTISEIDATSSYLPGLLPAGTWKLLLGVPNIRPGVTSDFTAQVFVSSSVEPPNIPGHGPLVLNPATGWYKGDMHTHTAQSDGSCASQSGKSVPCPEFKLLEAAAARGLDFLAVTDHNTESTYNSLFRWQPYFDKLLLIRGREITTYTGHTNVYGTSEWIDFRVTPKLTADQLADQVHRLGALMSLNHPALPSGEMCMGCGWTPQPPLDDAKIDAIEVINGPFAEGELSGISFWEERLDRGFRITAIGGSDDHSSGTKSAPGRPVGTPTTVVYARELSEAAILEAVRAGHVFIKARSLDAPDVYLTAIVGNKRLMAGDNVRISANDRVEFSAQVVNGLGHVVEVIQDRKPSAALADATVQSADQTKTFTITGDGKRHWVRVNLRDKDGVLLVVTNPVYLNYER